MKKDKTVPIRDLLVKLEKYYKDIYIIHGNCFCEGEESSMDNPGYYFGVFEPHVVESIRQSLPDEKVLFIENIRNAKDDIDSSLIPIKNDSEIQKIESKFDKLYEEVRNCNSWLPVPLTDELISKIFSEGDAVELKLKNSDGKEIEIVVSKSCFPGITAKRFTDLSYIVTEQDHGISHVIFRYAFEYFTIYLIYAYLY